MIFVLIGDELQGAIALADIIRPESKEAIASLKEMGIRSIMLTGDNRESRNGLRKRLAWMNSSPRCFRNRRPPRSGRCRPVGP